MLGQNQNHYMHGIEYPNVPSQIPYYMNDYNSHIPRYPMAPYQGNPQWNWTPPFSQGMPEYPYYSSAQIPVTPQIPMNMNSPSIFEQSQSNYPNQMQSLFKNPLQPVEEPKMMYQNQYPVNGIPNMNQNAYPKQSFIPKQSSGINTIMNSFKSQDGSLDFNKMFDTAGQMMNAVTQVSTMVKGLGGIFKA